jgi:hemerythrin
MKTLQWGSEYFIGVPEIDDQHKEFVNIINKINWAEEKAYPREIGARLIYELMKYAEFHFACEENLMYLHKYPGLDTQMNEHKKLLGVIKMKIGDFQSGKADYDSVTKFAFMWLISHTTEEDRKFGKMIQNSKPV